MKHIYLLLALPVFSSCSKDTGPVGANHGLEVDVKWKSVSATCPHRSNNLCKSYLISKIEFAE
ncbi:hypothetical protein BC792_107127 [Sphingobacterium allocomposti]|uniref:Lipoprotein n=1 Tax=Sphingobacterium allocomposti TaxID=415956 RepID=A0A5S5DLH9_9SPHI|nr:hypothetical protein BC792_107127 [Sphingobacterium composti Yoo et al. 2007 non Ten et al. 2007]